MAYQRIGTQHVEHVPIASCDSVDEAWIGCSCGWSSVWADGEGWLEHVRAENTPAPQTQTSGPRCRRCNGFTTYKRRDTHGLCMKCEGEVKAVFSKIVGHLNRSL